MIPNRFIIPLLPSLCLPGANTCQFLEFFAQELYLTVNFAWSANLHDYLVVAVK